MRNKDSTSKCEEWMIVGKHVEVNVFSVGVIWWCVAATCMQKHTIAGWVFYSAIPVKYVLWSQRARILDRILGPLPNAQ